MNWPCYLFCTWICSCIILRVFVQEYNLSIRVGGTYDSPPPDILTIGGISCGIKYQHSLGDCAGIFMQ